MRESAILAVMPRETLAHLTMLAACSSSLTACSSPQYEIYVQQHADDDSSGAASGGTSGEVDPTTTGAASSTDDEDAPSTGSASADASTSGTSVTTDSGASTETTDASDDPPVGEAKKPTIVSVDLPAMVYAAGPVPLTVQTENTAAVHVRLDDADVGELVAAGGGLFTGELVVRGAIDDGPHEVEVIAEQGQHVDVEFTGYEVKTPKPGTEAWSQLGPTGSRTNRIAVTPAGDLLEGGQTGSGDAARPTIRKRSGITGAELWPEKTITLDANEGAVVGVAVLPDGRMWVAMNVREPMKDSRARIALLDAEGHATGVELLGTPGRIIRGIAVDADGGCFGVGVAGVMGDWDFAYWAITAAGVQTLGDVYDYRPKGDPHKFRDLGNDVVIDGDVAWVIGLSQGQHEDNNMYTRGVLVPMDVHTGEVVAPVVVAPMSNPWAHSAFFGGALHPEGVLATGYGCDIDCETYRIETALYTAAGERLWHVAEGPTDGLAYGSDVALDSQGRALVAGAVTQNGKLRGYVFARTVGEIGLPALEHWFPGLGPSEGLGVVRDSYDRLFPAGYITVNGEPHARVTLIHG
jgi:hypothetical protein